MKKLSIGFLIASFLFMGFGAQYASAGFTKVSLPPQIIHSQPTPNWFYSTINSAYGNQNTTSNNSHYVIAKYLITNAASEPVRLTNLKLDATLVGVNATNFTNVTFYNPGANSNYAAPYNPSSFPYNEAIPAIIFGSHETKQVVVYADIGANVSGSITTNLTPTGIGQNTFTLFTPPSSTVGQTITINNMLECNPTVQQIALPNTILSVGILTTSEYLFTNPVGHNDCKLSSITIRRMPSIHTTFSIGDLVVVDPLTNTTLIQSPTIGSYQTLNFTTPWIIHGGTDVGLFVKTRFNGTPQIGDTFPSYFSAVNMTDASTAITVNPILPVTWQTLNF